MVSCHHRCLSKWVGTTIDVSKWVGTTHPNSSHMSCLEGQAHLALELQSYLWSKTGFSFLTLVCSVAQEIYADAKESNARQFRSPFPGQGAATTLTFFSIEPYSSPAMNNFSPLPTTVSSPCSLSD